MEREAPSNSVTRDPHIIHFFSLCPYLCRQISTLVAMAPNVTSAADEVPCTTDTRQLSRNETKSTVSVEPPQKYRTKIVWPNVVMHVYINLVALHGLYLMFTSAKVLTAAWGMYLRMYGRVSLMHAHMCLDHVCVYTRGTILLKLIYIATTKV
jgi:hypothetical protein